VYKRRSGLVQDLWVIQEASVGIGVEEGGGRREREEWGEGVRYMLSSQPPALYVCIGLACGCESREMWRAYNTAGMQDASERSHVHFL